MTDLLADYRSYTHAGAIVALDVAAKATLLCLAPWMFGRAVGPRRVLARSLAWQATLAGLLVLPPAGLAFPRFQIAYLAQASGQAETAGQAFVGEAGAVPAADVGPALETVETAAQLPSAAALSPTADDPPPIRLDDAADGGLAAAAPPSWLARFDVAAITMTVYWAVAALCLLRLARSFFAVAALRRSSDVIDAPVWTAALARSREKLAVPQRVELACSRQVAVPVVIGWLRPMILVPERLLASEHEDTVEAILLHELAHVRRGDYGWNLLSRLAQVVYWPHPFVWLLGREIAKTREQACDESCIYLMGDARRYRASLIAVAGGLVCRPREGLGMAMAAGSKLAQRLARIDQSSGQPRCTPRWPARASVIVAALVVCGLLGPLRFGAGVAALGQGDDQDKDSGSQGPFWDDVTSGNQYFVALQQSDTVQENDKEQGTEARGDGPVRVTVAKAERADFRVESTQPGTVTASRTAEIYARVTGFVAERNVEIGDRVKKGELLAVIEAPELDVEIELAEEAAEEATADRERYEAGAEVAKAAIKANGAKLAEAESAVESARKLAAFRAKVYRRLDQLARVEKTMDFRVVDEREEQLNAAQAALEAANTRVAIAQAELPRGEAALREAMALLRRAGMRQKSAQRRLSRSRLRDEQRRIVAPFDGVVSYVNVDVGSMVRGPAEKDPLFVVNTTERMVVVVQISSGFLGLLDRGDTATIQFNLPALKDVKGAVSRIGYGLNPATSTIRAEIDLPNPDGRIRPGMSAWVTILLETHPKALTVPQTAMRFSNGMHAWCYRVVNGRAVKTAVKFGFNVREKLEIIEGLTEGEAIVTGLGHGELADGREVEVVDRLPAEGE
ncbi:MAG TPA: efflux RND transporter periplasmic adaptor subunit [Pirellulales bacterium]|nr:efflux RND transporter periplasmic adaptor subunit [Pirellulales bacterium]